MQLLASVEPTIFKMKYDVTAHSKDIKTKYEEFEGKEVAIAGRVMQKRVMGKVLASHILYSICFLHNRSFTYLFLPVPIRKR